MLQRSRQRWPITPTFSVLTLSERRWLKALHPGYVGHVVPMIQPKLSKITLHFSYLVMSMTYSVVWRSQSQKKKPGTQFWRGQVFWDWDIPLETSSSRDKFNIQNCLPKLSVNIKPIKFQKHIFLLPTSPFSLIKPMFLSPKNRAFPQNRVSVYREILFRAFAKFWVSFTVNPQ